MDRFLIFVGRKKHLFILFALTLGFNILLSHFMPKEYALDLKFAYTFQEVIFSMDSMGMDSRHLYSIGVWTLDFPYLVVYSLFFVGVLFRLYGKKTFIFLPLGIALMDLIENILVLRILKTFPELDKLLVQAASFFTTFKWILVAVMMTIVLIGLVRMLVLKKHSFQSQSEVEA